MSNLLDILQNDTSEISKDIISYYKRIFKVNLPIEVQKIISYQDENIIYKGKKYIAQSPDKWHDHLSFYGFDFKESGIIPLFFLDEDEIDLVCYAPKEKVFFSKNWAWVQNQTNTSLLLIC